MLTSPVKAVPIRLGESLFRHSVKREKRVKTKYHSYNDLPEQRLQIVQLYYENSHSVKNSK